MPRFIPGSSSLSILAENVHFLTSTVQRYSQQTVISSSILSLATPYAMLLSDTYLIAGCKQILGRASDPVPFTVSHFSVHHATIILATVSLA